MSDSRGGCQLAAVPPTLTVAQATGRGFTGLTHSAPEGAGAACRTGGGRRIHGRHRTPGLTGLVQPVPVAGNTSGPRSATLVAERAEPVWRGSASGTGLVPRRRRRPGALCFPGLPWPLPGLFSSAASRTVFLGRFPWPRCSLGARVQVARRCFPGHAAPLGARAAADGLTPLRCCQAGLSGGSSCAAYRIRERASRANCLVYGSDLIVIVSIPQHSGHVSADAVPGKVMSRPKYPRRASELAGFATRRALPHSMPSGQPPVQKGHQ
jgi:hypothetical protein